MGPAPFKFRDTNAVVWLRASPRTGFKKRPGTAATAGVASTSKQPSVSWFRAARKGERTKSHFVWRSVDVFVWLKDAQTDPKPNYQDTLQ